MPFVKRLVVLSLLLFAVLAQAKPRVIVVYAGTPRGGSGDIAANWLMAEELKRLHPDDRIVFVVDPVATQMTWRDEEMLHGKRLSKAVEEIVPLFVPGYKPGKVLTHHGVEVLTAGQNSIPAGDHTLAFSMRPSDGYSRRLVEMSPNTWIFTETDRMDPEHFVEFSGRATPGEAIHNFGVHGTRNGFTAVIGSNPWTQGLFVSPTKPTPPLTREALLGQLPLHEAGSSRLTRLGARLLGRGTLPKDAAIAVGYSHYGGPTQQYVDFVKIAAAEAPYEKRPVVLVVKNFETLDLTGLPKNVRVVLYDTVPATVHESLIAHSDFPPLVTGIASMSAAVQYEKFFFYDPFSPARYTGIPASFLGSVLRGQRSMAQGTPASRVFGMMPSEGTTAAETTPAREHGRRYGYKMADLLALHRDTELQNEWRASLAKNRQALSMALTATAYMQVADSKPASLREGRWNDFAGELMAVDERRAVAARNPWTGCGPFLRAMGI